MPEVPQLTPAVQAVVQTPPTQLCPTAQQALPQTRAVGQQVPPAKVWPAGQLVGQAAIQVPAPPLRQVPVTQK
jgi:hypothetical protein